MARSFFRLLGTMICVVVKARLLWRTKKLEARIPRIRMTLPWQEQHCRELEQCREDLQENLHE